MNHCVANVNINRGCVNGLKRILNMIFGWFICDEKIISPNFVQFLGHCITLIKYNFINIISSCTKSLFYPRLYHGSSAMVLQSRLLSYCYHTTKGNKAIQKIVIADDCYWLTQRRRGTQLLAGISTFLSL